MRQRYFVNPSCQDRINSEEKYWFKPCVNMASIFSLQVTNLTKQQTKDPTTCSTMTQPAVNPSLRLPVSVDQGYSHIATSSGCKVTQWGDTCDLLLLAQHPHTHSTHKQGSTISAWVTLTFFPPSTSFLISQPTVSLPESKSRWQTRAAATRARSQTHTLPQKWGKIA